MKALIKLSSKLNEQLGSKLNTNLKALCNARLRGKLATKLSSAKLSSAKLSSAKLSARLSAMLSDMLSLMLSSRASNVQSNKLSTKTSTKSSNTITSKPHSVQMHTSSEAANSQQITKQQGFSLAGLVVAVKQQGFTLVELVIVIAILGILAASAAPKFINLQTDAQTAVGEAIIGSLKGAVEITYSKAVIENQYGTTGQITVAGIGKPVELKNGYPKAKPTDATATASIIDLIDSDDITVDTDATAGTTLTMRYENCVITYTDSIGEGARPVIAKTGC
jgi:MSHA pilin protein MshA